MVTREYHKQYIRHREIDLDVIQNFMSAQGQSTYTPEVCNGFIEYVREQEDYSNAAALTRIIRTASALLEFAAYGFTAVRHNRKTYSYSGEIGDLITKYVARREKQFAEATVVSDRLYLERFNEYLNAEGCIKPENITPEIILRFAEILAGYSRSTISCTLRTLRLFLSFLHGENITDTDFSLIVPKNSYRSAEKLPSLYTKDEVIKLLGSIERKSPMGKRDYAILLTAARLGLRASDLSGLKFSDINWRENRIFIAVQQKTKKPAELPLLNDVGAAIIDYLKYGRPKSDSEYVFLRTQTPYTRLVAGSMYNIAKHYFAIAGIESKEKRKQGTHALRHSLAGRLLENKTPLPVITEIFIHESTETTQEYIRIDMETLQQCALAVAPTSFFGGDA
ncbi:MAG: site-specific integrase [Defluviitaleaceae bacterium]|nr:site-specific integrase [Defluviitaleaceae bacterium]